MVIRDIWNATKFEQKISFNAKIIIYQARAFGMCPTTFMHLFVNILNFYRL